MRKSLVLLLVATCLFTIVALGDIHPSPPKKVTISSSGGGSRSPDIENFIRQVESWKTNYPDRFDYLKTLLYKQSFTTTNYVPPGVWLYYPTKNKTISRYDPIEIGALVVNTNPIELRRALYLTLEIQEPGESSFKPAKVATQIIQVNEYDGRENTSLRIFPELSSFDYLGRVGDVRLKIYVTDGQYKYDSSIQKDDPENGYYHELALNVYNIPPQINNTSMLVNPDPANWDDTIQYTATLDNKVQNTSYTDLKKDMRRVTLHILNNRIETNNITKLFQLGDKIEFSTKDKNIFSEKDSGKNFSYRYSCSDGVLGGKNTTWTEIRDGPHLKRNPMMKTKDIVVDPEDNNYYWWQKYNFGFKAKSQNPDGGMLTVSLYTDTPAHPQRYITSQTVPIPGDKFEDVSFKDIQPFDVADCGQMFRYYFKYSLPDENGNSGSAIIDGPESINTKLVRYSIYAPEMIVNLSLIMTLSLLVGVLVERGFYRRRGK